MGLVTAVTTWQALLKAVQFIEIIVSLYLAVNVVVWNITAHLWNEGEI